MLSTTLSLLCDPLPTGPSIYTRPPYRAPSPPPYCGCCHCSHAAHVNAHYQQHHQHQHQQHDWAVERYPTLTSEELAYMRQLRSLALLQESVKKLHVPTASDADKTQLTTSAISQAVIDAVAATAGRHHHNLPVSTLFNTIRKQRAPPRYRCCECGSAQTTQWRNSPTTGKKICNPCGMRLWRRRKQEKLAAGAKKEPQTSESPVDDIDAQQNEAAKEDDRRRSNIYNLLN